MGVFKSDYNLQVSIHPIMMTSNSKTEPISFENQSEGLGSVPLVRDRLSQPTPIV